MLRGRLWGLGAAVGRACIRDPGLRWAAAVAFAARDIVARLLQVIAVLRRATALQAARLLLLCDGLRRACEDVWALLLAIVAGGCTGCNCASVMELLTRRVNGAGRVHDAVPNATI